MDKRETKRIARLLPDGNPKDVRVYDNGGTGAGGTIDRYTVVFTGRYTHKTGRQYWHLGMSGAPFHPQGFCQHGTSPNQIDVKPGSWGGPSIGRRCHLGLRIPFTDLPEDCQRAVIQDYLYLRDLPGGENHPSAVEPFAGTAS